MKHWLVLGILIGIAVMLSKVVFEDLLGIPWASYVERLLADPGPLAAVGIVALLSIDLLLPIPSSLVMILSGALFGVLGGGLLSLIGSLAGNYLGFELTRTYGRGPSRRLVGEVQLARMSRVFEQNGALAILLSRPLPVVMETMSLVAGLSLMKRSTFLLASLAGTIPVVFAYSLAGALSLEVGSVAPALVMLICVIAAAWLIARPRLRAEGVRLRTKLVTPPNTSRID